MQRPTSPSAMADLAKHLQLSLEDLDASPLLRDLHDWWRGRPDLPKWSDVNPFVIPKALLSRTLLVEMNRHSRRFKIRLAGTQLCAEQGRELKGAYVDEILSSEDYKIVEAEYLDCAKQRKPRFSERHVQYETGHWVVYRVLILPLAGDDGEVAGFISCSKALR